jgi:ribosome assembly protein 4
VWRSENGAHYRTLTGHAHWINTLALNVDYVLRTGAYNPETQTTPNNPEVCDIRMF